MKKATLLTISSGIIIMLLPFLGFAQSLSDSLSRKIKADSAALKNTTLKVITTQATIDTLTKEKEELKKAVDQLAISTKELESKAKKTSGELEKLKAARKDLDLKKQQLSETSNKLKTEIASLEKTKADQQVKVDSLIKQTSNLTEVLAQKKIESENYDETIEKQKAAIAAQLDSMEVIAQIEMNDSIKIFTKDQRGGSWAKIEKVHIAAKEGVILELIVTTNKGVFRNKGAVIDLVHFDSRGGDTLKYEKQRYSRDADKKYIFLDDVIIYSPVGSYSKAPYAEFDVTLTPDKDHRTYLIKESTSINTYFNIAAYTDIKGIGGEPNGIAQFYADAKFLTNTRNIKNSATIPFNFASFSGNLSKYDSEFKGTELINNDSINRKDLFQRSTYSVGLKMNVLHGLPSPFPKHLISDWQINVGYNFVGSRISDTTFTDAARTIIDTTYKTVTQSQLYVEPQITLNRNKNFALKVSFPVHMIGVMKSAGIVNRDQEYWASPSIELMYFSKRNTDSKLFFRYKHWLNLGDSSQAFTQIQLGYSVNLTSVWGQK